MKQRFRIGLLALLLVVVGVAAPYAQTLPAAIQQFWNLLSTGSYAFQTLRLNANSYENWGTTLGTNGYGFRDNSGTLQTKNSGGAWANITSGGVSGLFNTICLDATTQDVCIKRPSANTMGFYTGGVAGTQRWSYNTTALTSTIPFLASAGTVALPSLAFAGDPDTGIWSVGSNILGITLGATDTLHFRPNQAYFNGSGLLSWGSSSSNPESTWDVNLGRSIVSPAAGQLALTSTAAVSPTYQVYYGTGTDYVGTSLDSSINVLLRATEATPAAPIATLNVVGGQNCTAGDHTFRVTEITAGGESAVSAFSNTVTCDAANTTVAITAVATGSPYVTGRNLYATKAGSDQVTTYLIAASPMIANNTATTYTFNTADASFLTQANGGNRAIDTRLAVNNATGVVTPGVFGSFNAMQLKIASQAIGDLLQADSTTTFARLPDVAVNQLLASGGVGSAWAPTGSPRITAIGLGAAAPAAGLAFVNGTVFTDSALGVTAMISSGAVNALHIPNGSNAEYGGFAWASNIFRIENVTNGGVARSMQIASAGAINFAPNAGANVWQISTTGMILASTNNANDIGGGIATNAPRTVYAATSVVTPLASAQFTSTGTATSVANVGANSCGTTAATIAGSNNTGIVTVGATSGTQCRILFSRAATTRRECTVTNETTANLSRTAYVDTTHNDLLGVFVAGDVLAYVCIDY